MLRKCFFLFSLVILFLWPVSAKAQQPYELSYVVTYILSDTDTTDVQLDVKITNPRSDLYVEKFSLSIPAYFEITDIAAVSPASDVNVEKEFKDDMYSLTFQFTDPEVGKNSENNLKITYKQKKLLRKSGTVIEAILPTMIGRSVKTVDVVVKKSPSMKEALSIAKPRPSENNVTYMTWTNVQVPSLYVLFGESQLYDVRLTYSLKNPKLTSSYMDIALPPETLYQTIYVRDFKPQPDRVYLDDDGNYMARYLLNGREEKSIFFDGMVQVFVKPQQDMIPYISTKAESQKDYLLQPSTHWNISEFIQRDPLPKVQSVSDIYHYVVDTLDYDYNRVTKDVTRLGAAKALANPQAAVCTEYADSFVALAREKGIMSREIEGYGFSQDEKLLPLSLVSDVLHAWPEFYDGATGLWRQVDPTWEDTSGIDFLSGFDVNHIAFVIHGKDSAYPLAAGMYKTRDSRDVTVSISSDVPSKTYKYEVKDTFSASLVEQKDYTSSITVKNMSNVFVKNTVVSFLSESMSVSPASIPIDILAPYQERTYSVNYRVPVKGRLTSDMTIKIGSDYQSKKQFTVQSQTQQWAWYSGAAFLLVILLVILGSTVAKKRKK